MFDRPALFPSFQRVLTVAAVALALQGWGLLGPVAPAQHPATIPSIANSASDTTLEVYHNGSLLAPGTYAPSSPADSIPAEDAGTRLMGCPAKAAFRAGNLTGSEWDAVIADAYSAPFAKDTKADGPQSTAMAARTTANRSAASTFGPFATASGHFTTSVGADPEANTKHSLSTGLRGKPNLHGGFLHRLWQQSSNSDRMSMGLALC